MCPIGNIHSLFQRRPFGLLNMSGDNTSGSGRPVRSQALDDLIMGTNSSSIVSKRSVERLYYTNEQHYYRYFVKKPQRRSPLNNRAYWLRLKVIDTIVGRFLKNSSLSKQVVISLGCGTDVLPWRCHAREKSSFQNAIFIDVDYPDLMRKKRDVVLATPELREILGSTFSTEDSQNSSILLNSPHYCQLACDLRDLKLFQETLESILPLSNCSILFVAEVSVTYMETESTDALIQWASSIGQTEFCLLEQQLPNGPKHPFAKTMLSHYDKINTPLKSIHSYPSMESQKVRFQQRGWQQIDICDLWDAWRSGQFVTPEERASLDEVEPFDEWEEFVLFGRHYFVMHARAHADGKAEFTSSSRHLTLDKCKVDFVPLKTSTSIKRRFGNATAITNIEGGYSGAHLFGIGSQGRTDTYDLYNIDERSTSTTRLPLRGPLPRVCSTLTDLGEYGILLVGGRGSPSNALAECWLLAKGPKPSWRKLGNLPQPLYRHTALRLENSSLLLVIGGKTGQAVISQDTFVFHPEKGWITCKPLGTKPEPVFGAVVTNTPSISSNKDRFQGLLMGGIRKDGTINSKIYRWELNIEADEISITFHEIVVEDNKREQLSLFGATAVDLGPCVAICGGVSDNPACQGQTVNLISFTEDGKIDLSSSDAPEGAENTRPLMIGSSIFSAGGQITVIGGGATCFATAGTYWETIPYNLSIPTLNSSPLSKNKHSDHWEYIESPKILVNIRDDGFTEAIPNKVTVTQIPRVRLSGANNFESILNEGKPVVIEDLDLGPCLRMWTPQYLTERVGKEKEFVVHESRADSEKMDFNSKNFQYVNDSFGNIMDRIQKGGRLYLRALSDASPSERPANLETDFPSLADDFRIPSETAFVRDKLFSSILRISGPVNMWLHYDVMANIYAQIQGSKRMILFPPRDVSALSFAPGASSSSIDVFEHLASSSLPTNTHPYEANLKAGDVLYIPTAWLHTASPTSSLSVAVNVFFRDLDRPSYSTGRDVYGNRDLAAYERGRQEVAKIGRSFDKLPLEVKKFYLSRLADELLQAAQLTES